MISSSPAWAGVRPVGRWRAALAIAGVLLAGLAPVVPALSGGPPDGHTWAPTKPREDCCCSCHDYARNTGPGVMEIRGVPSRYTPGARYLLLVVVEMAGQQRWGFELSVRDADLGQAGDLLPRDETVQRSATDGIQFAKHAAGALWGPSGRWNLTWVAPSAGTGRVTFYGAGNAANGDGDWTDDWIYTTSVASEEAWNPLLVGALLALIAGVVVVLMLRARGRRGTMAGPGRLRTAGARRKPAEGRRKERQDRTHRTP